MDMSQGVGTFEDVVTPLDPATGERLAIGFLANGSNWVLLREVSGRPGYKQLRFCSQSLASQLNVLNATGKLRLEEIYGLGCSIVRLGGV